MSALADIMNALREVNFGVRMSREVEGEFKRKVDSAMPSIDTAITEFGDILPLWRVRFEPLRNGLGTPQKNQ